jgi:hypothetical protein
MIFTMPVRLFLRYAIKDSVDPTIPDLSAGVYTAKLDATQKELSDAFITCALAKENIEQLNKR